MPEQDLPREKLLRRGRAALSDEELIALFLRTGLQGCNVLELAAIIKREAGSLARLGMLEAQEIATLCKGIGPAKAATLAAVFELGQRAAKEQAENQNFSHPRAVYDYLVPQLRFENQENFIALLLNVRHNLIRCVHVAKGTNRSVIAHARDIFRDAVRLSAHCIILAHNHPSGDTTPSKADKNLTERLVQAGSTLGIAVIDHVIIGASSAENSCPYYSFQEKGTMPHASNEI